MLLSARKILLIHFLMRLPDFVRPAVDAADRIVKRYLKCKVFGTVACTAVANQPERAACLLPRTRRLLLPQKLPASSDAHEG